MSSLISALLDLQVPNSVHISPNCQQIVYSTAPPHQSTKDDHPLSTLWLARTGYRHSARKLTSGLTADSAPQWTPDGRSIAFLSDRANRGSSSAIYLLPVRDGGEAQALTLGANEAKIEKFWLSPDGSKIALISPDEKSADAKRREEEKDDAAVWGEDLRFNRLRIVDVADPRHEVTTLFSVDGRHVVDCAWSPDGGEIVLAYSRAPGPESRCMHGCGIAVVRVEGGKVTDVARCENDVEYLTWAAGDEVQFISKAGPESVCSSAMVYSLDLKSRHCGGQAATVEKCAHGETDCALRLSRAGQDVVVYVQHGMEEQVRMLNGKTLVRRKAEIAAWDAAFTSDSDEVLVALVTSDTNTPWEVYSTTASGGAMVPLSNHGNAFVDTRALPGGPGEATPTFLSCTSADGKVQLDALFVAPPLPPADPSTSKSARPHPTVVLVHGGPYSRITDAFCPTAYFPAAPSLLAAGYALLFPNYRGSSGRGAAFAAAARNGMGTVDYDDCIALTQHAIDAGLADQSRLAVAGWSQGGFMAYLSAVRNGLHGLGWRFRAAVAGAGVADWDTMIATSDRGAGFELELAGKAAWRSDKSDTGNRKGSAVWEFKRAGVHEAGGVVPPVLILHGQRDERVPLEQAVVFRRALEDYGLPFEFVTYPREPHIFKERKHIEDMVGRTVDFIQKYV